MDIFARQGKEKKTGLICKVGIVEGRISVSSLQLVEIR
jgi:hypothetical protein